MWYIGCWITHDFFLYKPNLYNKRACPQTMFKILRLWRQRCQIKRITGLPKTWGWERGRAENKNPRRGGGGRGDTCNARVGPTSTIWNLNLKYLNLKWEQKKLVKNSPGCTVWSMKAYWKVGAASENNWYLNGKCAKESSFKTRSFKDHPFIMCSFETHSYETLFFLTGFSKYFLSKPVLSKPVLSKPVGLKPVFLNPFFQPLLLSKPIHLKHVFLNTFIQNMFSQNTFFQNTFFQNRFFQNTFFQPLVLSTTRSFNHPFF